MKNENIQIKRYIIDLMIKEIDNAWWSEGCLFGITTEEADVVSVFIKEYNNDGHLDLLIDEHNPDK